MSSVQRWRAYHQLCLAPCALVLEPRPVSTRPTVQCPATHRSTLISIHTLLACILFSNLTTGNLRFHIYIAQKYINRRHFKLSDISLTLSSINSLTLIWIHCMWLNVDYCRYTLLGCLYVPYLKVSRANNALDQFKVRYSHWS